MSRFYLNAVAIAAMSLLVFPVTSRAGADRVDGGGLPAGCHGEVSNSRSERVYEDHRFFDGGDWAIVYRRCGRGCIEGNLGTSTRDALYDGEAFEFLACGQSIHVPGGTEFRCDCGFDGGLAK